MNKVLFIDILTTGPNPNRCGIYAMGGCICEDSRWGIKELKRFEYRLRPFENVRISDHALWLGGVTRSQMLYFQKEEDVLNTFTELLADIVKVTDPTDKIHICGFNSSSFDMPFVKEWFERNNNKRFRDYFYMQSIDLMTLSAFALMDERQSMKEYNLETVARKLGIITTMSEKYSCLDNVNTCKQIYQKLKERFVCGKPAE